MILSRSSQMLFLFDLFSLMFVTKFVTSALVMIANILERHELVIFLC